MLTILIGSIKNNTHLPHATLMGTYADISSAIISFVITHSIICCKFHYFYRLQIKGVKNYECNIYTDNKYDIKNMNKIL